MTIGRCVACGRTETRLIAPTYVECKGFTEHKVIIGEEQHWVIPGGPPTLVSIFGIDRRPCRIRRHESAMSPTALDGGWPSCLCGTFAIGFCAACRQPVCGDDSLRQGRTRLCLACDGDDDIRRAANLGSRLATEAAELTREAALDELRMRVEPLVRTEIAAQAARLRADPDSHLGRVQQNKALTGPYQPYVARMLESRESGDDAEFERLRDALGCGDRTCTEPLCLSLQRDLGLA